MQKSDSSFHDAYAADYDRQVLAYRSYTTEVLFGLCFDYVSSRQRLLDVGTGSGLAAQPFAKMGLRVFGIDAARKMLALCQSKGFAAGLLRYDILATPWPYAPGTFDHVVACGVLHFLNNLPALFGEVARLVRPGGIFAFTTKAPGADAPPGEVFQRVISGVPIFEHSQTYIEKLVVACGFEVLKDVRLFVQEDLFHAFVTRKP